jgi:LPS-assembly protein
MIPYHEAMGHLRSVSRSRTRFRLSAALCWGFWSLALTPSAHAGQGVILPSELRNAFTTVTIRADSQQKLRDTYKLLGHVEVSYREMRLTADQATYNSSTGDVEASGRVAFSDPKAYLEADHASYNVVAGTGTFSGVHGYIHPPARSRAAMPMESNALFVRAREVARLDEDRYTVDDGRVTSCEDEGRGWSLSVHRARLTVGDKVVSYGDTFRFFGVPLLYAPALVHSVARTPRQTGFLIPSLGNSSQKGRTIGDGFYWAISPSADLLLGLEDYSLRGLARSGRFRAQPSDTSDLSVDYFGVNDHGSGPLRAQRAPGQSLRAIGQAGDLGGGFRGLIDVDYINTLAFRLTWSGSFTEAVSSEARQSGFLTKNSDGYSLNFYAERYQDFLSTQQTPGNSIIIRHTPSVSFSGIDHQIGHSPLYFDFDASADGLRREQPGFSTPTLSERVDFHPEITLRMRGLWGFHFTPTIGAEATRYGTSLLGPDVALTRLLGNVSFDLRPPAFERIFDRRIHHYRLKHVIEPDIRYRLVRAADPAEIADIVRFDETDVLAETNEIEYSLKSTLYGRPETADDGADRPQARELMSLSVTQKYYFDPTFGGVLRPGQNSFQPTLDLTGFAFAQGRRLSPLVTVFKFAPFSNYDTELRADFSPSGGGVLNAGITSAVHRGQFSLEATDFFISRTEGLGFILPVVPLVPTSALPSFNLLNTRVAYGRTDRKGLSGAFGVNYNFVRRVANALVGQVTYNFGCFGVDMGYNRFNLGPLRDENQFRIAISLSNVGSFGNLKSRDRLYQ